MNREDQEALALRIHKAVTEYNTVVHATFTETNDGMPALVAMFLDQPLHVVTEYRHVNEEYPTYRLRISKKVGNDPEHDPYMYVILMLNENDKERTDYGTESELTGCDISLFVPHIKEDENVLHMLLQQYGFNTAHEPTVP
jgi:hypothetical protein